MSGDNGKSNMGDECEHAHSFHQFATYVKLYETATKLERQRWLDTLSSILISDERIICANKLDEFRTKDVIRLLTYGLGENVDRVKKRLAVHLNAMCDLPEMHVDSRSMTDQFLLANLDNWYAFAIMDECGCHKAAPGDKIVRSNEIRARLRSGDVWEGRMCRICVNALLRIARSGLCPDLAHKIDHEIAKRRERDDKAAAIATIESAIKNASESLSDENERNHACDTNAANTANEVFLEFDDILRNVGSNDNGERQLQPRVIDNDDETSPRRERTGSSTPVERNGEKRGRRNSESSRSSSSRKRHSSKRRRCCSPSAKKEVREHGHESLNMPSLSSWRDERDLDEDSFKENDDRRGNSIREYDRMNVKALERELFSLNRLLEKN